MGTRLIELADGTLVEVDANADYSQEISGGLAEKIDSTLDQIYPTLVKTCRPVLAMCRELEKEVSVESAEVELGLSFEGEGNLYLAKFKSGANLVVKLKIRTT
jgi:Trypsin-co-occurring domain 1